VRTLTYALIALCCAPPLYLQFLPMVELPQYVALSRMLWHLHDRQYDFGSHYALALDKSLACVPLYLLGGLGEVLPHELARRMFVTLCVAAYPLGLCSLLVALRKPTAYALLGLPLVYASPMFAGLLPSCLSVGLALGAIALLERGSRRIGGRVSLAAVHRSVRRLHRGRLRALLRRESPQL
jgi:hypothetical protein